MLAVDADQFAADASLVAEADMSDGTRSVGRQAETAELLFPHGEMKGKFVVDVAFDGTLAERESKQSPPAGCGAHANSSELRRNATAIASAWRCHSGAWARNRARPAAVSR